MTTDAGLDGTFASERLRRQERRWQTIGLWLLAALVVAALAGVIGEPAAVGRAAAVYTFLLLVFRVSGRRTLAQVTNFDLVLVLIIGDATQQALIGDDYSVTTGLVVVATLAVLDIGLAQLKRRWPVVDVFVDGLPLPLVVRGVRRAEQMASEGVTRDDLLTAARESQGLTRLDDIDFAVLEQNGAISIIPRRPAE